MIPLKPCLDCGRRIRSTGPRCGPCDRTHQRARNASRVTLYGGAYPAWRRKLLARSYGRPCPRCGLTLVKSQTAREGATYDHDTNTVMCRSCNSSQRRDA